MKHLLKTIVLAASLALIFLTFCYFPGSGSAKIKLIIPKYVKAQLKEGERFRWGDLKRKCGRPVEGRDCKYAEEALNL